MSGSYRFALVCPGLGRLGGLPVNPNYEGPKIGQKVRFAPQPPYMGGLASGLNYEGLVFGQKLVYAQSMTFTADTAAVPATPVWGGLALDAQGRTIFQNEFGVWEVLVPRPEACVR